MGLHGKELSFRYQTQWVLDRLSIDVAAGEVVGILGPNGCGKTTLMRTMSRLVRPEHGAVSIDDSDLWRLPKSEVARKIALAPQSEQRDWPLTVQDAVRLGRAPHRGWFMPLSQEDEVIVDDAIRATGLTDITQQPITQLSGGQWRRMVLARALAQQAEMLLLDEPTSGLDLRYQVTILKLVQQLAHDRKLTVVMTLHDLNLAAVYCDRIGLMEEGKVRVLGSPAEVLTEPHLQAVFGIDVTVIQHPVYGTPLVAPVAR